MSLATGLGELLGGTVRGIADLGASHGCTLHRAILSDGRDVFVKAVADDPAAVTAEARGLGWLAEAAPDAVVRVLAADDRLLVLPWLPEAAPAPDAAEQLGRDLAALHAHTRDAFGAPWSGRIARLPLDNTEVPARHPATAVAGRAGGGCHADEHTRSWGRWYAERRLAPYLPAAARYLGGDGIRLIERVVERAEELEGPPEPPARVHGDLWSGNIRWSRDRARLVDPAAHAGHRETDLAMLALFGAPHLDRMLSAYHEARPPADGWRERIPLHQLHPLLVHVVLFGTAYRAQTLAAAGAALAA